MSKTPPPSALADKFMLRLPDGLRERIAEVAKENGRSMNSEIVAVLEALYPAKDTVQEVLEMSRRLVGEIDAQGDVPPKITELRDALARVVETLEEPVRK